MNIYASFSLFTVIVLIYSVIIELFTIGLSDRGT